MWVDTAYRGRGYSRALLNAFVAEASSRGVRRIWVASYDFQAPRMYEKAGFKRMLRRSAHSRTIAGNALSGGRGQRDQFALPPEKGAHHANQTIPGRSAFRPRD